ncbi:MULTISPECIES: type II secretion system protein [unclassified Janthinobacterium]|uniref:type II secretion system protein n=1 Tax=unclassified Janthinobacterium TaxID=2610881 RepID=UPI00160B36CB|nr:MULTISPECIES: type II secretion system protein [unclassified Janthinobacterium]MBB5368644.1 MSHA pilin protein MshA [Janthinobacterium sp. K2C7]MBB5381820.1 MSHA pilin protein MshA [Janthinobacterium sp. K2Li3]MBB5387026.1 MSHA pilin protein MshA [Janthinobacterium sp. K2E3]
MNKSVRSFKSGAQAGFTLIELIVVIVILGILAATAIPKFIDVSTDARVAKMAAAAGSLKAGAALYHSQWLIKGSPADGSTVSMEGTPISAVGGYPDATANGIQLAAGLVATDYALTAATGSFTVADLSRSGCSVVYTPASTNATTGAVTAATVANNATVTTCK